MTIAGDICIYTNDQHRHRGAVAPWPFTCPRRTQTAAEAADAARDRRRARQLHRRPGAAKRAVAIALRNRLRRQQLPPELAEEVAPKNIIMIGPTGVGKTEIARRLAKLAQSPFLKVEASKFTEVGYVGRDVESMVRDLVEIAVDMVRDERRDEVRAKATQAAEERLLDLCCRRLADRARRRSGRRAPPTRHQHAREAAASSCATASSTARVSSSRCATAALPSFEIVAGSNVEEIGINLKDMLPGIFQGRTKKRAVEGARGARVPDERGAAEARRHGIGRAHGRRARRAGRHHLPRRDRQDRRAAKGGHGPDVSREGVQRDLLPIVEGTTVNTKYGMVKTDHILFIAAGAFHVSKPSDLIPELQGRFPIRVELEPLDRDDFVRILTEPERARQAVLGAAGDRGRRRSRSRDDADRPRSPTSPPSSTSAPRTSARAACTPSWNGCSTSSRSTRPTSPSNR